MLRADMDALPVREETGLPYASTQTATDATVGPSPSPSHRPRSFCQRRARRRSRRLINI